jgi:hypothetical protein
MKPRWTLSNTIVVLSFMTGGKPTHQTYLGWRTTMERVGMFALKANCIWPLLVRRELKFGFRFNIRIESDIGLGEVG